MKRIIKQFNKKETGYGRKAGFTIVELLTVMSIIVILIGLLVPALNMAKQYAKKLKQMAMFHSIDAALELFNNEFDGYPPSGAMDSATPQEHYCGAMKLCEAMMGQDLLGFHTNSVYRKDGSDGMTPPTDLYPSTPTPNNLKARKGPFLPLESANAFRMGDIYKDLGPFDPCSFVLCDEYTRAMQTGKKTGMPILYYKANTANNGHHDPDNPANPPQPSLPSQDEGNIYNYYDNYFLIERGKPWTDLAHSLVDYKIFYKLTKSHKITTAVRPYRADSYILLSAGFDGEYGTADDIFNFEWKYRAP